MSDRKSIKQLLFEGWHIQLFKNDLDTVTAIGIKDGNQVIIDVISGDVIPVMSVLADKIDQYEAGDDKMAEPYVNLHDELVEAIQNFMDDRCGREMVKSISPHLVPAFEAVLLKAREIK